MKLQILFAGYFFVVLTGCSGAGPPHPLSVTASGDDTGPSGNTKISFGLYDIAKGPGISDFLLRSEPLLQKGVAVEPPEIRGDDAITNGSVRVSAVNNTRLSEANTSERRKILKHATLKLESAEPDKAQHQIEKIGEANGGFVVETDQMMNDVTLDVLDSVSIRLRVPSENFEAALTEIRASGARMLVEASKGEDVTEEFVDLEARVGTKKALEQKFLDIMKNAGTVEDALLVQSRISEVREEIERMEGRRRYLADRSEYSTIDISIRSPAYAAATNAGFFHRLGDAAGQGSRSALNFTLGLVTFVIGVMPFAVFVGIPSILIGRVFWQRSRSPISIVEGLHEEIPSK